MQCSSCKEIIDDDSCYCDQCGEQIFVCTVCGRPGKGKRCILDGKEMIQASEAFKGSVQPASQNVVTINTHGTDNVKLTSQIHGIMIEVNDGDIIGRKSGAFTEVFGRFNFVSGTHCKFTKTIAGWHIQDMGSTNGTFYNGSQLAPNRLYPILNNTIIKIADVELLITYNADGGGITRL